MHVGLDLDNTIILYDELFHTLALERGLMDRTVPVSKAAVRDAVRARPGGHDSWIELQAQAYGSQIGRAKLAPGAGGFLRECACRRVRVSIVSHKTVVPVRRTAPDLRQAALGFLEAAGLLGRAEFGIRREDVHFLSTRSEKLRRIESLACGHFVDDLLEVLTEPAWPSRVERIQIFARPSESSDGVVALPDWRSVQAYLLGASGSSRLNAGRGTSHVP